MRTIWRGAAVAMMAAPLVACGGGGGSTPKPPITLEGATYRIPNGDIERAELRELEGGSGETTLYVDDGAFELLTEQTGQLSDATTVFRMQDGSVAFVTAPSGYESMRLITLEYEQNGVTYFSEGVIGRFTSETDMARAAGTATYTGIGTANIRASGAFTSDFDMNGGNAFVEVDFDRGRVKATLDFAGTPDAASAPIDTVLIENMVIDGNRFSGGSISASNAGVADPDFDASGRDLNSSGVFAGWNDSTGAVRGGDRPAEVGGTFVANLRAFNVLVGRYIAD